MKRFIQTLKNIWSIEDLRKRILYTIGLVLIYRIGSYVVLPGVDPSQLSVLRKQGSEGLMGLLNMFSGGAFSNASIFALGIMPYITASIVIQLLVMVVPKFGFKNINRVEYVGINIDTLNALAEAKNITDFNIDVLKENGLISGKDRIKILGRGELAKAVNVTAHAFSATAKKAIEDKGGVATVIE